MKTVLSKLGQPPAPDFPQMQTCEQQSSDEGRNGHEYVKMRMHKKLSYWLAAFLKMCPCERSRLYSEPLAANFDIFKSIFSGKS